MFYLSSKSDPALLLPTDPGQIDPNSRSPNLFFV